MSDAGLPGEVPPARHPGGCLCGRVRYAWRRAPALVDLCHCRICQRWTGAPAAAWATGRDGDLVWTAGEPAAFRSSSFGVRYYCRDCGTPLAIRCTEPEVSIGVLVTTTDRPADLPPRSEAWTGSRIPWHPLREDLPHHEDDGPLLSGRDEFD